MPPRSKVITMLPPYIRQEVNRRLFENGFRDYEGLAQWVRGQGYEISDDSLWRYGRALRDHLAATDLTVRHARALAKLGEDYEGLTAKALITLAQQKALETLLEMEEVKPADLNAVATLTRAAIAQQRWAAELKLRAEQQKRAADTPQGGTPKGPPETPPNAQPVIAPPQQQAIAAAPTVKAERRDGPATGDGSESTRAMSIPPVGDSQAAPDNTPAAAIVTAPLRGSPRIVEMTIPFATSDSAADAIVSEPGRDQPDLIPGRTVAGFLRRLARGERTSRYARHPEPSADRFCRARRSPSVRGLMVSSQRRCRNAYRRSLTQINAVRRICRSSISTQIARGCHVTTQRTRI